MPALGLPAVFGFSAPWLPVAEGAAGLCYSLMCDSCILFDPHAVLWKIVTVLMPLLLCSRRSFPLDPGLVRHFCLEHKKKNYFYEVIDVYMISLNAVA